MKLKILMIKKLKAYLVGIIQKVFCKRGVTCKFFHSSLDCRQHIKNRKCLRSDCNDRHREDCLFQNRRGGCNRPASCAFLHRTKEKTSEKPEEDNQTKTQDLENIKQLEVIIKDLKKDIEFKDEDIIIKINEIDNLKREVKEKVAEIKLKEAIIKKLEDEESFSQESEEEEQDLKKNYDQHEATCKFQGNNESESDGEYDLFQLEVVSDEEVYCCNICNEGFDSEEEVKEHLKLSHKKVLKLV